MNKGVTLDEQQALMDTFEEYLKEINFNTLSEDYNLTEELSTLEKDRIIQALENANGNQTKAAEILKIGRTCLIAKMKKFNLF
jgi:transcriptional regulator with PAS, ATPase and Fis domain